MRAKYRNQTPRQITARFNSVCAETGRPIQKGDQCLYFPSAGKVFALDSKNAADWASAKFDEEVLGNGCL